MIRSLNTAEQAMQMQQVRIDALANNLANANSTGFKQVLTRVAEVGGIQNPDINPDVNPRDVSVTKQLNANGAWPKTMDLQLYHATDTRNGPVRATGRDTDVAVLSRGFFALQTPDGERYTRAGAFRIDNTSTLVTPDGTPVLGDGGPIKIEGKSFSIENNGSIMVDGNIVGRFKLVDFADTTKLEHLGANLLRPPENMMPQPVPAEEIVVAQGHLEGSNVNPIDTLVAMITAQRAFEVQSKVTMTEDDMLSKSVNKLPQVSG